MHKRRETRDVRQMATIRAGDAGGSGNKLVGYAALFNTPATIFDPFFSFDAFEERIAPGAFDRTLRENPDVRALRSHDWNLVLGRGKNGTLRLSTDATGLRFEVDLNLDTTIGRDTKADVERGDIDGCSFGFIVRAELVDRSDRERIVRTITDLDLIEITPACAFPAYAETSVAVRHLAGDPAPSATPRLDMARRKLGLLRL